MNSIWIPIIFITFLLACFGGLTYLECRMSARINKLPYPIPSMDHCVQYGLLDCGNCRHKTTCFELYPNVFPDFKHKCSANFTFEGNYFHYTIADERIPLSNKEDEKESEQA